MSKRIPDPNLVSLTNGAAQCIARLIPAHNNGLSLFRSPQEVFYMALLVEGPLKGLAAHEADEAWLAEPFAPFPLVPEQREAIRKALIIVAESGEMPVHRYTLELLKIFEVMKQP